MEVMDHVHVKHKLTAEKKLMRCIKYGIHQAYVKDNVFFYCK